MYPFATANLVSTTPISLLSRKLPKTNRTATGTRPAGEQPLSLKFRRSYGGGERKTGMCITMRDRSKNRKPLQRGRSLSIEAIQTVQSLKRAQIRGDEAFLESVFASKFKRLLKLDMVAVLRELLQQNECLLALKSKFYFTTPCKNYQKYLSFRYPNHLVKVAQLWEKKSNGEDSERTEVFEDIQKEYWYKPQVSLYAEVISVLGKNGLLESTNHLFKKLKMEASLPPDTKGFNVLLESFFSCNMTGLAMECFYLMKSSGCEPDKSSFRILITGLESSGELGHSAIVMQEAEKYYGKSLDLFEDEEEQKLEVT